MVINLKFIKTSALEIIQKEFEKNEILIKHWNDSTYCTHCIREESLIWLKSEK